MGMRILTFFFIIFAFGQFHKINTIVIDPGQAKNSNNGMASEKHCFKIAIVW